jgi:serine/threonine-protein kinase
MNPDRAMEAAQTFVHRVVGERFYLRDVLGVGGTSAVYEADDLWLDRTVAVKVLLAPYRADPELAERLRREARASAAVAHPNVATVIDVGALEDGSPFLVMDRLVGETLHARLARGPLAIDEAADVLTQLLSALDAVHAAGLVHRDVKPGNVFLSRRQGYAPLVRLLDFGAATRQGERPPPRDDGFEAPLTQRGFVVGTPQYLSPEQVRGERDFDATVDLYACGVLLFEMLTRSRPFPERNVLTLFRAIVHQPAPCLRDLCPDASAELAAIVTRALAKNRARRPQSAVEMQGLLRAALAGPAPSVGAGSRSSARLPAHSDVFGKDDWDAPTVPRARTA